MAIKHMIKTQTADGRIKAVKRNLNSAKNTNTVLRFTIAFGIHRRCSQGFFRWHLHGLNTVWSASSCILLWHRV